VFQIAGPVKSQEIVGELSTALVLNLMGFTQSPFNWYWHDSQGPDQVAKHAKLGVWGIFEAKGGNSPLGMTASWGSQMSGGWLKHWVKEIYQRYEHTNAGLQLKQAYLTHKPMLAAVVRLNLLDTGSQLKITVQKYVPPNGTSMTNWGDA
jgi:hypothetical protein